MRRLSMKSKRRKSESSNGSDSEENGVAYASAADGKDAEELDRSTNNKSWTLKRSPGNKKRRTRERSRSTQKVTSGDSAEEQEKKEDTDTSMAAKDEENGGIAKGGATKRRKKDEQRATSSGNGGKELTDGEYEVQKIVGQRMIKGRRQFLVRWKGYDKDSDTWEHEKDLSCANLIDKFLEEEESEVEIEEPTKSPKSMKVKSAKTETPMKKLRNSPRKQIENNDKPMTDTKLEKDNQKEYEVEKIIEVHFKKNKMREFLIRWKGFNAADDTWEPEENLNCPDVIAKFMKKVEKAKTTEMRELRANRPHTKRYTLHTADTGRRLSRRNLDKQRRICRTSRPPWSRNVQEYHLPEVYVT